MLVALAFCPSPPLLTPALAGSAATELDPLRAACATAVDRLVAAGPDRIVVVGTGARTEWFPAGTAGTLAGYGVPVVARLPGGSGSGFPLPLSLTLGAWLLAGAPVPCLGLSVAASAPEVDVGGRVGVLVMGDGSARRTEAAPGYVDPRAEPFDAAVAAALAAGDAAALRDLDAGLGADLLAAGVPAWKAAGAAAARDSAERAATGPASAAAGAAGSGGGAGGGGIGGWVGEVLYDAAPYGVGYLVAVWGPR